MKRPKAATYPEWENLDDLVVIDSYAYERSKILFVDNFGTAHDGYTFFDASKNAYALYNLNGEYKTIRGAITTSDSTGDGVSMTVNIYLDDELVLTETGITKQTPQINFEFGITGKSVLKITASNEGEYSNGRVYIVDDILTN